MDFPIIRKAYVDTEFGQLHYRYAIPSSNIQEKSSSLLFLHKSASSSASYELLMRHFVAQGYRCFAPDMPGFGGSFDPPSELIAAFQEKGTEYSAWYVSVFISAFSSMNLVKPGTKCHIMGHHSGAALAVEIAAIHQDFVSSICLVGPTVMDANERATMKEQYFKPFNIPEPDGSHLVKTWNYLSHMGVGEDITLWQREAVDHIRAWKGRNQIYGAIWAQDGERLYMEVKSPILLMCAKDDVLWKFFDHVRRLRPEAQAVEIEGGNFELDRDCSGIISTWSEFLVDL